MLWTPCRNQITIAQTVLKAYTVLDSTITWSLVDPNYSYHPCRLEDMQLLCLQYALFLSSSPSVEIISPSLTSNYQLSVKKKTRTKQSWRLLTFAMIIINDYDYHHSDRDSLFVNAAASKKGLSLHSEVLCSSSSTSLLDFVVNCESIHVPLSSLPLKKIS